MLFTASMEFWSDLNDAFVGRPLFVHNILKRERDLQIL